MVESQAPAAVRTFLIADVRGYTSFTLNHGDEAAARLATRFAEITRDVVARHEGDLLELRGDEALAVFTSTRSALRSATELQQEYAAAREADASLPMQVGIGLDVGEAVPVAGGFRGAALNLASRLCSLAGPGEVLASESVIHLARRVDGLEYIDRGAAPLKGFDQPVMVVAVSSQLSAVGSQFSDLSQRPTTNDQRPATSDSQLPIGGYLGSLPAGPLVGRDRELEEALQLVDAVAQGNGKLLFLSGEPGAGKTRLGQELTLTLRDMGFIIAAGRCYEAQATVPFYPFLDALTFLYVQAHAHLQAQVSRSWPDLARLLPALGLPVVDHTGREDQQRLFWAVTGFVQAVAAQAPVALLLDDLHWADAASLDLLQHLARHTGGDRLLILGTYRDVEVGRQHPLEAALRDLQREALLTRIDVRRLGQPETAKLIAATMDEESISDEFAALVYRRTEGNPFFVQQVLHVLVERGDVFRLDGRWDRRSIEELSVPESIRSVVGQRLSRLAEETQEVLREASVLGQTFRFEELQAMSGRTEDDLERALDQALGAGLVRDADRDGYMFDHALTQGSLYGELSSRRKRRLHLAAGEAIEGVTRQKRAGREAELAWHFLEGDDPERAFSWSLAAGAGAEAMFAHSDAEYHLRTARSLAAELEDGERLADALERLGAVLFQLARYDEALVTFDEALTLHRSRGGKSAALRIAARIGWTLFDSARFREGVQRLQTIAAQLDPNVHGVEAASVFLALADLTWGVGENERALELADRGVELAQAAGADSLVARGEVRRSAILPSLGRFEEALSAANHAIALAESIGDLLILARAINNRALEWIRIGDRDREWADLEWELEITRRLGNPSQIVWALGLLAETAWSRGELARAMPYAEEGSRLSRRLGRTRSAQFTISALAKRVELGDSTALEDLEALAEEAEQQGDASLAGAANTAVAFAYLILGRPEKMLARLERVSTLEMEGQFRPEFEIILAVALLANGRVDRAEATITQWLDRPGAVDAVRLLFVRSGIAAARGRLGEANLLADEALARAVQRARPWDEALIQLEWGRTLMKHGIRDEARERIEAALTIYRRMGSVLSRQRAERVLAELDQLDALSGPW